MTKESAFRNWLEQGGAQTASGRDSRVYAIRTIERKLEELGMPVRDLDAAWKADRFESLRERLGRMREDARSGGRDYRLLMPNSENPHNRLSNWQSWLGQYGRFLDAEPPGSAKDADRIRQYVLERYVEPAREEGRGQAEVLVRDVNTALGLKEAWPNICQALAGRKFQDLAQIPSPERVGADQSPATVLRFDLRGPRIDSSGLNELRERFLVACPDFRSFVDPGSGWAKHERTYKAKASERVRTAREDGGDDEALGEAVLDILETAAKDGPLVRWQTRDKIAKQKPELLGEFHTIVGRLIRSDQPAVEALSQAFDALAALKKRGAASLTYGERLNILFSSLSMVRSGEATPLKITRINEAWETLTGEKLFVEATASMASDYRRFAEVFAELFEVMRDEWQWQPQDWLDLQGFLWIACHTKKGAVSMPIPPLNLVLYGPPGTGKTFLTAAEAVRLCGEPLQDDRDALMQTYERLLAAGRIEFVTFHQSMSYEDFVEGRQPMTGSDEELDPAPDATGSPTTAVHWWSCSCLPHHRVLHWLPVGKPSRTASCRRIAKRAETSRGRSTDHPATRDVSPSRRRAVRQRFQDVQDDRL